MNEIGRLDRNGKMLKLGDIVAEGRRNESIWNGQAIIVKRPVGIVRLSTEIRGTSKSLQKNKTFEFNVEELASGAIEYTRLSPNYEPGLVRPLHLSMNNNVFTAWDDIEYICNANMLDNFKQEG